MSEFGEMVEMSEMYEIVNYVKWVKSGFRYAKILGSRVNKGFPCKEITHKPTVYTTEVVHKSQDSVTNIRVPCL